MRSAERTAEHGEILREHEDAPPADRAVAGDDTVARNSGIVRFAAARRDEAPGLYEASGIEQELEPLSRRELACRVLFLDARGAAAGERGLVELVEARRGAIRHGAEGLERITPARVQTRVCSTIFATLAS